jgi:hypothetical protein
MKADRKTIQHSTGSSIGAVLDMYLVVLLKDLFPNRNVDLMP